MHEHQGGVEGASPASVFGSTIPDSVEVRFGKRAHNPYLLEAGFPKTDVPVP